MRTRNNKLINFILEFSQIALVFLGVFSAMMCTATSLELTFDRNLCMVIMLLASVLFYGLFTVLETFHNGKLYGLLGITLFFAAIIIRFLSSVKKGFVTVVNNFLKEFMNYSGSNLTLLSYTDTESASVKFCTTLLLILLSVYLIAVISAFFYRRRRSVVFLAATLPFVLLPLLVGRLGYFSNLFTYLIVAMAIVGSRHLRTDATDRRMRQKLSILLLVVGLLAGGISYAFVPPERYERNTGKITQVRNSVVALTTWSADDVFTWFKAYFNDDAIDYGKIGKKNEITYSGETLLKISGDVNTEHGLYLKGYVGDSYENNKWSSLMKNDEYKADLEKLESTGVTLDNWHVQLRNELGDSETSGVDNLWNTGTLRIRNLAFGYGNYLVPYLPAGSFKMENNGRVTIDTLGIDYKVEYFNVYPQVMRRDLLSQNFTLASALFWDSNKEERQQLTDFAKKYYVQVPESLNGVCNEFKDYLKKNGDLLTKYEKGSANQGDMIRAVKSYITKDTTYTLAPGKTPSNMDTVEYFLKESKKGYCTYYATTAAVLLRSVGIPTRYVEGMYVSKEELADCISGQEISVPDRDAHAWVEIYQDKYGFIPLEVTPGIGEEEAGEVSAPSDSGQSDTNTNPADGGDDSKDDTPEQATPTPAVTEMPEESMTFDDIDGNEDPDEDEGTAVSAEESPSQAKKLLWKALEVLLCLLLIVVLMEAQRRVRRHIFMRNLKSMRMKKKIRMVHHHLIQLFAGRGVIYKGQTVAAYADEIASAMGMPEKEIREYVSLVFHARFGPDDITEEQLAGFRIIYENIRRKAYEDAKLFKKLYYMYIMVL